jgi:hypothetical protein
VLADPLQRAQHAGVEPPVGDPSGPMDGCQRRAQPPRHDRLAAVSGTAIEGGQLAVVAEAGQGHVHGVELGANAVPRARWVLGRVQAAPGSRPDVQAQGGAQRTRGERDRTDRVLGGRHRRRR